MDAASPQFRSTRTPGLEVDLAEAVLQALPADGGLYVPARWDPLPAGFFRDWRDLPTGDLASRLLGHVLGSAVPDDVLAPICDEAFDFPCPLIDAGGGIRVLELFHGPTLAFKDFGARFMARLMAWLAGREGRKLTVLTATSGDTGGAVADAFHGVENTRVVILYPAGRVSPLQEKQFTTLGGNITALAIDGTFDDCQRMVKAAFIDRDLGSACALTSANSINIARLLPQMLYYFLGARAAGDPPVTFVVPSGNFGNLTAGVLAHRLGMPAAGFLAATNTNDTVPRYLESGTYAPRASVATLSNAMDVGSPSNFERLAGIFGDSWASMRRKIAGMACDDAATRRTMARVREEHGHLLDPHTAVGWHAADKWLATRPDARPVVLATAHPAKFLEVCEEVYAPGEVMIPDRLARLAKRPTRSLPMENDDEGFKAWLRAEFG